MLSRTPQATRTILHRALNTCFEALEARALFSAVATADYLSDLSPTSVNNGYGPIGIDQSNGEADAGDGRTIDLKRTRYAKGLGVHAPSDISYNLAGNYATFVSDIGIDHESGAAGSADFQVYGDDTLLYDSGTLLGNGHVGHVNVDVSGVQTLRLVVSDGGDGTDDDHADWAGARVVKSNSNAPSIFMPSSTSLGGSSSAIFASGSFVDIASAGPFAATVDYGDGIGAQSLYLNADQSFDLLHSYINALAGKHTVTVKVSDGSSSSSASLTVTTTNDAPTDVTLQNTDSRGRVSTLAGLPFNAVGTFDDDGIGSGGTYTYSINYGDGTKPATGTTSSAYYLQHTYAKPGKYALTTTITDGGGNVATGTNTVLVAAPSFTPLGSLTPTDASDDFVTDVNAGTGKAMSIRGTKFAAGIGTLSDSEITFNLNGNASWLLGSSGIDDAASKTASADFQIYTDGSLVYESGTTNAGDKAKSFQLNVKNVQQIRLVVLDGGNGEDNVFADWAGIRFV